MSDSIKISIPESKRINTWEDSHLGLLAFLISVFMASQTANADEPYSFGGSGNILSSEQVISPSGPPPVQPPPSYDHTVVGTEDPVKLENIDADGIPPFGNGQFCSTQRDLGQPALDRTLNKATFDMNAFTIACGQYVCPFGDRGSFNLLEKYVVDRKVLDLCSYSKELWGPHIGGPSGVMGVTEMRLRKEMGRFACQCLLPDPKSPTGFNWSGGVRYNGGASTWDILLEAGFYIPYGGNGG